MITKYPKVSGRILTSAESMVQRRENQMKKEQEKREKEERKLLSHLVSRYLFLKSVQVLQCTHHLS
jgi:hypothetical protein